VAPRVYPQVNENPSEDLTGARNSARLIG